MTAKIFSFGAKRCEAEQAAYDAAQSAANDAKQALRTARHDSISAELAECGISKGSPVIAVCAGWHSDRTEERGIVRGWDFGGVRVAKRNKDGSAHATQDLHRVQSITLDTEALKGGAQ